MRKCWFTYLNLLLLFSAAACKKTTSQAKSDTRPVTQLSAKPLLNDVRTGSWRGYQRGLYPDGLNTYPSLNNNTGLGAAAAIGPRDANGLANPANGKIGWLSVGMFNTTQETPAFTPLAEALPNENLKLVLIDGAHSGWDIDVVNDPNAAFWTNSTARLSTRGITASQVQAIWLKQADKSFPDTSFSGYPSNFKNQAEDRYGNHQA
jgi:hypothetical protein